MINLIMNFLNKILKQNKTEDKSFSKATYFDKILFFARTSSVKTQNKNESLLLGGDLEVG